MSITKPLPHEFPSVVPVLLVDYYYGKIYCLEENSKDVKEYELRCSGTEVYIVARGKAYIPLFTADRTPLSFDKIPAFLRVLWEQSRLSGGSLLCNVAYVSTNLVIYTIDSVIQPAWNFGSFPKIGTSIAPLPVEVVQSSTFATKWAGTISATTLLIENHYGKIGTAFLKFGSITFNFASGSSYSLNFDSGFFPGWFGLQISTNGTVDMRALGMPNLMVYPVVYYGFNKLNKLFEFIFPVKCGVDNRAILYLEDNYNMLINGDFVPFLRMYYGVFELVANMPDWQPELVGDLIIMPVNY